MATKTADLRAAVRSYTGSDGKVKRVWETVGAEWTNEKGQRWITIARWFNPAGLVNPDDRPEVSLAVFTVDGAASGGNV